MSTLNMGLLFTILTVVHVLFTGLGAAAPELKSSATAACGDGGTNLGHAEAPDCEGWDRKQLCLSFAGSIPIAASPQE